MIKMPAMSQTEHVVFHSFYKCCGKMQHVLLICLHCGKIQSDFFMCLYCKDFQHVCCQMDKDLFFNLLAFFVIGWVFLKCSMLCCLSHLTFTSVNEIIVSSYLQIGLYVILAGSLDCILTTTKLQFYVQQFSDLLFQNGPLRCSHLFKQAKTPFTLISFNLKTAFQNENNLRPHWRF